MEWSDHGIVLSSRPHGETGLVVVAADTRARPPRRLRRRRHLAQARPIWQPGNVVEVAWRARLAEQLGNYTGELREAACRARARRCRRAGGPAAACALVDAALPEREPHPAIFDGFHALLGALGHPGLAGDLCPAGARACCRSWASASISRVRGDRHDRGSRLSSRPGPAAPCRARPPSPIKRQAAALPAFLSTGGLPADDGGAAARPRFDRLFPRAPRLLATQQALACRAGEIYGNAPALRTTMARSRRESRLGPPHVAVDGQTQHQRRSARGRQAGAIRTGAPASAISPMRCRRSWRARCRTCATG